MITNEMKDQYLKSHGLYCPFCHDDNIEGLEFDYTDGLIQYCRCNECGKQWYDMYELSNIKEINNNVILDDGHWRINNHD